MPCLEFDAADASGDIARKWKMESDGTKVWERMSWFWLVVFLLVDAAVHIGSTGAACGSHKREMLSVSKVSMP